MTWRLFFGSIILLLGAGYALDIIITDTTSKYSFISIVSLWWPLFIMAIGLNQLMLHKEQPWGALVVFAIGAILQVYNLDEAQGLLGMPDQNLHNWLKFLVALLVIVLAIRIMLPRRLKRFQPQGQGGVKPRFLHLIKDFMMFGSTFVRNDSQQFSGGSVSAILGDYEIDLRGATLARAGAVMKLSSFFGTLSVHIPQQMALEMQGIPVLGAIDNTTHQIVTREDGVPVLKLKCIAIFGSIEITN